jgi:diaminopimelate decarboxylase
MRKWITDPIHISKNKNSSNESCEAFIFGNLCKEDDVLLDRKVYFDKKPKIGDLLVFVNTAGYAGNFEDTNAILQPKNKNYVCLVEDKNIIIHTEKEYLRGRK